MRFSFFAITSLFAVTALAAKPLKNWRIDNEADIEPFYRVVSHRGDTQWVTKEQIITALTKAAESKHDDTAIKKPQIKGSYPHIYTNNRGPWPALQGVGSMANGEYFEMQIGTGQRNPLDARAVYTITGDNAAKNAKMGEKQPLITHFVGVMKHGANRGDPFEIVAGQQDQTEQAQEEEDVPVETAVVDNTIANNQVQNDSEEEEKIDTEPVVSTKKNNNRKFSEDSGSDDEPTGFSGSRFSGLSGSRFVGNTDKIVKRMVPITFRA